MNKLKTLLNTRGTRRLTRRLSAWAWEDMLRDVGLVEWKFGRNDDGTPKDWTEWDMIRDHLRDAGHLRQVQELSQVTINLGWVSHDEL